MLDNVEVKLDDRSYTIHIGTDLLQETGAFIQPLLRRKKIAVVTDENVASLHLNMLKSSLSAEGIEVSTLILPAGESTKSWMHVQKTVEWLLAEHIERDDIIVAFGGEIGRASCRERV